MKNLNFNSHQCVLIENREQYSSIYHQMRSARKYDSLEDWEKKHGEMHEDMFPFYLVWCESVTSGRTIGRGQEPMNIWTKANLEVLKFEQATKER